MLSRGARRRTRQDPIPPIRLLVNADIVREAAQQVELGFDPAKDLIGWGEEFQVVKSDCGMLSADRARAVRGKDR
jgi:hypothetical protein